MDQMPDRQPTPDEVLKQEFNRWAEAGEGAKMERHHLDITEKTIRLMDLRAGERVLDLGCGSGWATRLLARLVTDGPEGFGQVVGVDVSDEMIRQARAASKDFENILYVWGSAHDIPWEENFFDKMLSVEHGTRCRGDLDTYSVNCNKRYPAPGWNWLWGRAAPP